ncbi:bifunctional DNA primase/polymerase [Dietzia maris]|uniref:bifunctional DNA primase/polymerase n=1 Tax=Dietzia maris TaxID=37915 RepID=UPI00232EEB35|nr:bifunctional DNA primase/polymerase [Dietzia maris]
MNPASAHRQLYVDCELYQLQNNVKHFKPGKPPARIDYRGGIAALNGSGGLIVVDIDGKNGGTKESLARALPGTENLPTRTVATASPDSWHLVYRLPAGFAARTDIRIAAKGVEVPIHFTLPGSQVHGVEYRVVDESPPAIAPDDLLAVLDRGELSADSEEIPIPEGDIDTEALIARLRQAPPGRRNETYTKVAMAIVATLGPEAGAEAIRLAWPGDEAELEHKLASTLGTSHYKPGTARRVSEARADVLDRLMSQVMYGPWHGRSGTMRRRVMWAILSRCLQRNELTVPYATGTLAVDSGTYPNRVSEALVDLELGGWIVSGNGLITVCIRSGADDLPKVVFGLPEPTDAIWLADRIRGRHSQVFAWCLAGVESGTAIAHRIGVSRNTASEQLRTLRTTGVLAGSSEVLAQLAETGRQRQEAVRAFVTEKLERKQEFENNGHQPAQGGRRVPARTVRRRPTPSAEAADLQPAQGSVPTHRSDSPPTTRDRMREMREREEDGYAF